MWDLTSLKVWWEKYGRYTGAGSLILLTFIAGWYTGRAMSPYYAAAPIVFDAHGAQSSGSTTELVALKAAGSAPRAQEDSPAAATPAPTIATSPIPNGFVGSKNSDKYHFPDCPSAKRIKAENQVWFATREEAEAAGYSPSACTKSRGVR